MEYYMWHVKVALLILSFLQLSLLSPDNEKLIKAVIVAGLYPKVAMIRPSYSKKRPG